MSTIVDESGVYEPHTAAQALHLHLCDRLKAAGKRSSYRAVAELLGEDHAAWYRWVRGTDYRRPTDPGASRVLEWSHRVGVELRTTPLGWECSSSAEDPDHASDLIEAADTDPD